MKKFLNFTLLASCFAFGGCSQTTSPLSTSPVSVKEAVAQPAPDLVAEVAEVSVPAAEEPAKPMKVKYVAQAKKWGTLRAKFVVDGKVAEPTKVNAAADPVCAALGIMTENLIVGKDGAIKNLAIYMDKKSKVKDVHPDLEKPAAAPLVLDNKNCVFVPHVQFVRPGQSIDVKNSDTTGHNANFSFFENDAVNFLVPSMGMKNLPILKEEPGTIEVQCNVHPWMKAYLIIQELPYCGITGEDGVLEIANLPVGQVTFRAWHELGKLDEVTVGGKKEKWSKNRFDFEIKEGMNDLGTVKISADKFIKK